MITLKEMLAEPQTMYDGGIVYMQDGGDPLEKLIENTTDLRQRAENIPVPTEEESLVGDIVKYAGKVGRQVGKIATKRVPGVGLISSSPAGEGSARYTPEEMGMQLSAQQGIGEVEDPYNKEVYHTTSELRWPNVREESGDIPNVNPEQAGSDIGFHVIEKKDLPRYYDVKKHWEEKFTMPLQANINKYLKVPDMISFKDPENWIRNMSYNTYGGKFFNDELLEELLTAAEEDGTEVADPDTVMEEYAAAQETQYPESVIQLYPDDPEYDEKIFMNIRPESMPDVHIEGESVISFEEKVKLWKDITRGALKFRDTPNNQKRNEQWVEFLRNILDKTGADAYGYENEAEGGGEISFMALHPEKVKSLFSKGFDPTKQEMGKYRGGRVRPMYDGGLV